MAPGGLAEDLDERRLAERRELGDRAQGALVQARGGLRPDAPQVFDRERVEERAFSAGVTMSRPSGFAARLAIFATIFVRATPTVIGSPTSSRTAVRSSSPSARAAPFVRASVAMSRNASSIDIASTTGAVRSNTAQTARLASM